MPTFINQILLSKFYCVCFIKIATYMKRNYKNKYQMCDYSIASYTFCPTFQIIYGCYYLGEGIMSGVFRQMHALFVVASDEY